MHAVKKVQQSNSRINHGSAFAGKRVTGDDPLQRIASSTAITTPDFEVSNCGSLFLLRPLNSAAKEWMQEHLPVDSPETQFWGEAIVIESRYLEPIIEGILADRLVLR
jgi:hypothetical protein